MKVTVCEFRNDPEGLAADWNGLVKHVSDQKSDWVLLPEMPFYPWIAKTDEVDAEVWNASVAAHGEWMDRLPELSVPVVLGSRPVTENGRRYNGCFEFPPDPSAEYRASFAPVPPPGPGHR